MVNGKPVDPVWATKLIVGKCAESKIDWSVKDLEANKIKSVESIEMRISVYDYDRILEDGYLVDQTVTFNP